MFVGETLPEDAVLTKPRTVSAAFEVAERPELKLFDYEKRAVDLRDQVRRARDIPKLSLFLQAGFGQPSPVNMLSDEFSSYYLGGLRLNWSLSSRYTSADDRRLTAVNLAMIDNRRETFLFNTNVAVRQQQAEIEKLRALIQRDDEIIALRASVKDAATLELENGVITVNDFLRETNAEDLARQTKILHEIQLLMALYALNHTTGN